MTGGSLDAVAASLERHRPLLNEDDRLRRSSVAMILREEGDDLSVLFIERAAHDGDPWSGDIGFPGGKVEAGETAQQAAERETREEVGLDLGGARFLGRLSDIAGAHLPVRISCFVYGLEREPSFTLSSEVRDRFWVRLADLQDRHRHVTAPVRFRGETFSRPAIILPPEGKPVLWGITYRLVMQFLALLDEQP